jgi:hypothetical protein
MDSDQHPHTRRNRLMASRALIRAVGLSVGVLLTGLLAFATPSYAASGDSVVGGGRLEMIASFSIDARGAGADDLATGTFTVSTAKLAESSTVSCLHVSGDTAWVGVTVTHKSPNGGNPVGYQEVLIFVASSPEVVQDTGDHDPSTCGTEPTAIHTSTVTQGGFTIRSAA